MGRAGQIAVWALLFATTGHEIAEARELDLMLHELPSGPGSVSPYLGGERSWRSRRAGSTGEYFPFSNSFSNPDFRLAYFSRSGRHTNITTYNVNRNAGRFFLNFDFLLEEHDPLSFFDTVDASRLFISGGVGYRLTKAVSLRGDLFTVRPTYVLLSKGSAPTEVILSAAYRLGHTGFEIRSGVGYRVKRSPAVSPFQVMESLAYSMVFLRPRPPPHPLEVENPPVPVKGEEMIFFKKGTAELREQESETIERLVYHLEMYPTARLFVESENPSSALSGSRIRVLKQKLVEKGIPTPTAEGIKVLSVRKLAEADRAAIYRPIPNIFLKIEGV